MLLSCSDLKRKRYAHQVTVVSLARLKMESYENYEADVGNLKGQQWHAEIFQKYPTFFFLGQINEYDYCGTHHHKGGESWKFWALY